MRSNQGSVGFFSGKSRGEGFLRTVYGELDYLGTIFEFDKNKAK